MAARSETKKKVLSSAEIKAKGDGVPKTATFLARNTNQAFGIAKYAISFINNVDEEGGKPDEKVFKRVEQFHTDSVVCGLSAIALQTNAPRVLREEAIEYTHRNGATIFGNKKKVMPEKAIAANASAVREWDSNGTVFGYNSKYPGHTAGEFGHNDYYPVVIAACQEEGKDGETAARGMIAIDEIRGRLAEVFSLKTYKIDHVVHGAIASAAVYGAIKGATEAQIESAIGMLVAHYIPYRAIRAGHQLSDSKGASAAFSTEAAILAVRRAMKGFVGPADIFRNPEAVFRINEPTDGDSPFDLVLSHSGSDFAVMGMHFKLGLYEHQSAGALQAVVDFVQKNPKALATGIKKIAIRIYQPAFGIIGDPAKKDPHTRQSADHSMVFIVARKLQNAIALKDELKTNSDALWQQLILLPEDYGHAALFDKDTRDLMAKIEFEHGGKEYDDKYPDGIPTSLIITDNDDKTYDSGFVMYPSGHARNTKCDLDAILANKWSKLAALATGGSEKEAEKVLEALAGLAEKDKKAIGDLYGSFRIVAGESVDAAPSDAKEEKKDKKRKAPASKKGSKKGAAAAATSDDKKDDEKDEAAKDGSEPAAKKAKGKSKAAAKKKGGAKKKGAAKKKGSKKGSKKDESGDDKAEEGDDKEEAGDDKKKNGTPAAAAGDDKADKAEEATKVDETTD